MVNIFKKGFQESNASLTFYVNIRHQVGLFYAFLTLAFCRQFEKNEQNDLRDVLIDGS